MEHFTTVESSVSAWDMMVSLASSERAQTISTCSSSLDQLLGGGFPLGYVTEVSGGAGCGKTQICFQACVNVQLPASVGGIEGEAIYLDSEKTFVPSRIAAMAESLCGHFGFAPLTLSADKVLSRVHFHRILSPNELLNVVRSLDQKIKSMPQVKLVIVDSVAAPLRAEFEDYSYRSEYLAHIGALLTQVAARHMIAVVVTNQMTTKLSSQPDENSSLEIPSLGKAWASVPALQIVIGRGMVPPSQQRRISGATSEKVRWAKLVKIASPPVTAEEHCTFQITTDGIRDA